MLLISGFLSIFIPAAHAPRFNQFVCHGFVKRYFQGKFTIVKPDNVFLFSIGWQARIKD